MSYVSSSNKGIIRKLSVLSAVVLFSISGFVAIADDITVS